MSDDIDQNIQQPLTRTDWDSAIPNPWPVTEAAPRVKPFNPDDLVTIKDGGFDEAKVICSFKTLNPRYLLEYANGIRKWVDKSSLSDGFTPNQNLVIDNNPNVKPSEYRVVKELGIPSFHYLVEFAHGDRVWFEEKYVFPKLNRSGTRNQQLGPS